MCIMGLIIKGTIPRVPPFALWSKRSRTSRATKLVSQVSESTGPTLPETNIAIEVLHLSQ